MSAPEKIEIPKAIKRLVLAGWNPMIRRRGPGKWDVVVCRETIARDLPSFDHAAKLEEKIYTASHELF